MRIARFTNGGEPMFGIIQEKDGVEMVFGISGDPLYTQIQPNGVIEPLENVRLLAPVIPRSKVVAVGKNFAEDQQQLESGDHGQALLFTKPNTSVIGPYDPIVIPEYSNEVAYEAEIAVVIKTLAKNVKAEDAHKYILGYTASNDLTALDALRDENQWFRAKQFDTSCPLGPWIETELDVDNLRIESFQNGEQRQNGTSALMIHKIPELIETITRTSTLLPGDVILTGTPAGGCVVQPGDSIEIEIEGLGTLTNRVISASDLELDA